MKMVRRDENMSFNGRLCGGLRYAVLLSVLFGLAAVAAGQSQLGFDVVDSIGWRGGQTDVSTATETYWYNEASDTVTVNVVFDKTSALAPLPPMLALAKKYGFDVSFNKTVVEAEPNSVLGPLMGVENTDSYSWQVSGLGKYVLSERNYGSGQVPAWLNQKLEEEVSKVLAAGHLSPWINLTNVPGSGPNARGTVYWNHPGENLYFLAEIGEFLPPAMQEQLRTYMQNERDAYMPEIIYSMPLAAGESREYFRPSNTVLGNLESGSYRWRCQGVPRIWNLYGLARYYEFVGQVPSQTVLDDCTSIVNNNLDYRDWASMYWLEGHSPHFNAVHGVNQMFAGLIGYIRLTRMAGDANAEALGWGLLARMAVLRFAMGKYTQYEYDYGYFDLPADPEWFADMRRGNWQGTLTSFDWSEAIDNVRQIHWLSDSKLATWEHCSTGANGDGQKLSGHDPWWPVDWSGNPSGRFDAAYYLPFADMVPELGRFFKDYLSVETAAYVNRIEENQPHWDCAYAEQLLDAECGYHLPSDSHGIFCARAWVLGDAADKMEKHVDINWLKQGDWFYMHKLAETIRAYRGVSWSGGGAGFFAVVGTSYNDDGPTAVEEAYAEAFAKLGSFRQARLAIVEENYGNSLTKSAVISEANGLEVYGASMGSGSYSVQSYDKGFVRHKGITVTLVGGTFDMQVETITMGPVVYGDEQTMIDNRQVPGAEIGARFTFEADPSVGEFLYVMGSLHNPEISYFATGLAQSIPADVPVIGGAHYVPGSSGVIYASDTTMTQSALVIQFCGDFEVSQSMAGPYWQAQDNPEVPVQNIMQTVTDITNEIAAPDLVISFICASQRPWSDPNTGQQHMGEQHQGLIDSLPSSCEYFGTYSGGEMGKETGQNNLVAGGGYVSMLAVKSKVGASNQGPIVDAGEGDMVALPPGTVTLNGTVLDDGLPDGTLITTWSKDSGPGLVTFDNANEVDTTATFGEVGEYVLKLTADDGEIAESGYVTIIVHLPDTEAPSVPANVVATGVAGDKVELHWDTSSDNIEVTGYRVYRNGSLAGTTDVNSFSDEGLEVNTTYAYEIEAFDFAGNSSAKSAVAYAKTFNDVLDGLVAWWPFDEGSGTTAQDKSGHGHTAVISGVPTWTTGVVGGAMEFTHTNGSDVASLQSLDLGEEFSFVIWLYPTDLGSGWQQPIRHGGGNWVQVGYGNCYFKSGGVEFPCSGFANNQWVHFACVREANGTAKIYKNGSLCNTGTNNPYSGAGNTFSIGGGNYAGRVDEVRVYDRALTSSEVALLENPGAGQRIIGDLDGDGKVNLKDFGKLANRWLWIGLPGEVTEDIIEDGSVDRQDLAVLANRWLSEN